MGVVMTSNAPSLSDYARRMRFLVEEDVRIAADLRELAKEMRDDGLSAASLKALVKAMVLADDGDEKPLERLKTKIQDMAIYADALGITIDGFGETIRFDVAAPLSSRPAIPAVSAAEPSIPSADVVPAPVGQPDGLAFEAGNQREAAPISEPVAQQPSPARDGQPPAGVPLPLVGGDPFADRQPPPIPDFLRRVK